MERDCVPVTYIVWASFGSDIVLLKSLSCSYHLFEFGGREGPFGSIESFDLAGVKIACEIPRGRQHVVEMHTVKTLGRAGKEKRMMCARISLFHFRGETD